MKLTKNPLYYLAGVSFISIVMSILLVFGKNKSPMAITLSVIVAIFSTWALIYLWKGRCPHCGAVMARMTHDIKQDRIETVPFAYYSQILKRKDMTEQPILSSRRVVQRRKQVDNIINRCKKCNWTWNTKKSYFLDSIPSPVYVNEK